MSDINLLPQDQKPKGYALKLSNTLRKVELIAGSLFLITLVIAVILNYSIKFQNNRIIKNNEILKSDINALEATEQKLVLIQDRVDKIKKIEAIDNAYPEALAVESIIQNLPKEVILDGILIEKDKSSITISSQNSNDLTKFFDYISNSNLSQVDLSGFKYDLKSGYQVRITIKN